MKSWRIDIASEWKWRVLMKADLENISVKAESVPFAFNTIWNNIAIKRLNMVRWMKSWRIDIASEWKRRVLMKADLENISVKAESVPFASNTKQSGQKSRPAPYCICNRFTMSPFSPAQWEK